MQLWKHPHRLSKISIWFRDEEVERRKEQSLLNRKKEILVTRKQLRIRKLFGNYPVEEDLNLAQVVLGFTDDLVLKVKQQ